MDTNLMHVENPSEEINSMLDSLEGDDWYFFTNLKSGSFYAKRREPYTGHAQTFTFSNSPEESIRQAYKIMADFHKKELDM